MRFESNSQISHALWSSQPRSGVPPGAASHAKAKMSEEEVKMLDSVTQCRVTSADDAGNTRSIAYKGHLYKGHSLNSTKF